MSVKKRLNRIRDSAEEITLRESSRFIIMSDCHRGDGSLSDNFSGNSALFHTALNHYYKDGYTYIELGDGDELWENKSMDTIRQVHSDTFELLSRFDKARRLYMLFGNHDAVKRKARWFERYFNAPEFPNLSIREALILRGRSTQGSILLLHGHQADFFNYKLWRLARFLVRHLWRPLELIGVRDPTSASVNHSKLNTVERELSNWAKAENQLVIAGHTHHEIFPAYAVQGGTLYANLLPENDPRDGSSFESVRSLYYNDGSCVHARRITGIEIADCRISLVAWSYKVRESGTIYIGKDILAGPRSLVNCFPITFPASAPAEPAVKS